MTATGPGASLVYDAHGNTIRLAGQQLEYDVAGRHVRTELDEGTVISYTYDASGRLARCEVTGSPLKEDSVADLIVAIRQEIRRH